MYTVVLLTHPLTPILDAALADALRNAWGGGDIKWLMPDVAAEFDLAEIPSNHDEVWGDLQKQKIDLCIVRTANRRKRVLIADMDSTMIEQECIDMLADEAGVGEAVADITRRAMNGEIEFEGAMAERVGMLKGQPETLVKQVLDNRITYASGGKVMVATMSANGAYAALVSGGFSAFTEAVGGYLGFDETRANTLIFEDGKFSGEVGKPILGQASKIEALEDLTARFGLIDDDVLAVGDGANDLGMLGRAGMGVALHAKPAVQAQANIKINHGDHTGLLFIQGFSVEDFAKVD